MRYFKDENNKISALEDNADKKYIKDNWIEISELAKNKIKLFGTDEVSDEDYSAEVERIKVEKEIEAKRKEFNTAIYKYLNDTCSAYKFGDSKTEPFRAISNYTGYNNEYREIAEKLGAWIAEVFKVAEQIELDVANGDREMPTVEEVLAELPVYGE
jgi:gamma-glutamyl:cysteine ligase YbdK (ATP-grasp superfamily)